MADSNEFQSPDNGWRKWTIYLALFGALLTCATLIWSGGGNNATRDSRIDRAEKDIQQIKDEYERKDVVEQRLGNIESSVRSIEEHEQQTNDTLQKLLIEARRR